MRPIIFSLFVAAIALTACQSSSTNTSEGRWNDMWTDIYLRHRYERDLYLHGYLPSLPTVRARHRRSVHHATPKATITQPGAPSNNGQPQADSEEVRDLRQRIAALEQRISALEQGLTLDVDARNKSHEQINALTAQLNKLISALNAAAAQHTPAPTPPPSMIKIPGTQ